MQKKQYSVLFGLVIGCSVFAANLPPIVNAGLDQETRLGYSFSLSGTASDDGLPNPDLLTDWTQISGPSIASIRAADALGSRVVFSDTGIYTFKLTANDGALSVSDQVVVTVHDSIPYLITAPKAGDTLQIGAKYLIRWQVDPPAPVALTLSYDKGKNFIAIHDAQTDGSTYEWTIPDTLKPGVFRIYSYVYFSPQKSTHTGDLYLIPMKNNPILDRKRSLTPKNEQRALAEAFLPSGRRVEQVLSGAGSIKNRSAFGVIIVPSATGKEGEAKVVISK